MLPSCILVVNNYLFHITFLKALQFASSKTWLKSTLGHCTFIPENNKTTCFTMKIDLKKFRNGVSTVVRKQISFLCCELFPAFWHFSNTTSCHWLSVNKIEWKIKCLFELSTFTANKIICQGLLTYNFWHLVDLVDKSRKEIVRAKSISGF